MNGTRSAVHDHALFVVTALHALGKKEGEFERLVGVEARIAMRVVAVGKVVARKSACAA